MASIFSGFILENHYLRNVSTGETSYSQKVSLMFCRIVSELFILAWTMYPIYHWMFSSWSLTIRDYLLLYTFSFPDRNIKLLIQILFIRERGWDTALTVLLSTSESFAQPAPPSSLVVIVSLSVASAALCVTEYRLWTWSRYIPIHTSDTLPSV